MILRLVQLPLKEDCVEDFKRLFGESHPHLMDTPGCEEALLRTDHADPTTCWTVSKWQSIEHLESYRSSDWFRHTWPRIKTMLASRAQAWTLHDPSADHHSSPANSS